jgi:transcription-repair coupling factor (superfamily II helicase)
VIQSKLYEFIQNKGTINHLIVSNNKEAILSRDIFEFLNIKTFILPHINIPYGDDLKPFREEVFEINHTLKKYYSYNKEKVLILTLATSLLHFPKQNLLQDMTLSFGDTINLSDFKNKLYRWGYMYSDMLELEGEVSIRGDIIDIYPPTLENPYRISLFGDEIESIRTYNISTGKSNPQEIESIIITPAFFSFDEDEYNKINEQIEQFSGNILEKDIESVGYWLINDAQFFVDDKTFFIHQNMSLEIEDLFLDKREQDKAKYLKIPSIRPAKVFKDISCPSDLSEFAGINSHKQIQFLNMNES